MCFGEAEGDAAARVPMRALKAGDLVLSSPTEATRVIVNQHAAVRLASSVVVIEHESGSLALTPDHVLWADGAFRAAREVREGSVLEPASQVTKACVTIRIPLHPYASELAVPLYASQVTKLAAATHGVVNPLTTRGTILAAGPTGVA